MTIKAALTNLVRTLSLVASWVCVAASAPAAFALQAPPPVLDGAQIVAKVPAAVWIFLVTALVAIGADIQQLRQLRIDLRNLKEAIDKRCDGLDMADETLHVRLNRHRVRLEQNELDIARIAERIDMRRPSFRSQGDPDAGRGE